MIPATRMTGKMNLRMVLPIVTPPITGMPMKTASRATRIQPEMPSDLALAVWDSLDERSWRSRLLEAACSVQFWRMLYICWNTLS